MRRGNAFAQSGFSLLEMLFVLSIVLVLSALAVPHLLNARKSAEEVAAEETLRNINYANEMYRLTYGSYAPSLKELGPPEKNRAPSADAADLLDASVIRGKKNGYRLIYLPLVTDAEGKVQHYILVAQPENVHDESRRMFCSSPSFAFSANCRDQKLLGIGELSEEFQ